MMKKKLNIFIVFLIICFSVNAQQSKLEQTVALFPYQQKTSVQIALTQIESWSNKEWRSLFKQLDDDSLKLKATYALDAYMHHVSQNEALRPTAILNLSNGLKSVKSFYAKDYLIQLLGSIGDDNAVPLLSKYLIDQTFVGPAARALATIKTNNAKAALSKALTTAVDPIKQHIQAAIDHMNLQLPESKETSTKGRIGMVNFQDPRFLLKFQDQMEQAKDPVTKRNTLAQLEKVTSFAALMLASKYLDDPILQKQAASIMGRMAMRDNNLRGKGPRAVLEKALPFISGTDSVSLTRLLKNRLKALPYDNGWESLFNGKDLTAWKGLVGNPISRAKMKPEELLKAEAEANIKMQNDWIVENGLLVFTGHGDNLCTQEKYGDFEMLIDWKITADGDAGIYLRGTPQVQIWDTARRDAGAQVGSGGLYNNQKNQSKPLVVADHKIGEWNNFHIIMKGDKVTVFLNGVKVTDEVVLENYWDRTLPIFAKEQIELQAHGTYVAYRNIYIRPIEANTKTVLSEEEKKQGFETLFDGTNLDKWIGNKVGYALEDGAIVTHPELGGGNLYTADEFSDFEYRFEFQLTPGANNGLGIRTPTQGDAAYEGMELQILDNESPIYEKLKPYQYHGSVYGVIPAKRGYLKPTGEWNEQTVIAKGNKIKVILNGQVILDGDIQEASKNGTMDGNKHPGLMNTKGHIGFLGHGDVVRFRNIRIKKL
jgi:hypothetical protein